MRYYVDCEFDGHNGQLLSIAMVREDGASIHIRTFAFATDPWVSANVMPHMNNHKADVCFSGLQINSVGGELRKMIGDDPDPVIVTDSPVDVARFCQALSNNKDGGWASVDYSLLRFEVHDVACYPTNLPGAVQHNAWWDAMALRHFLEDKSHDA